MRRSCHSGSASTLLNYESVQFSKTFPSIGRARRAAPEFSRPAGVSAGAGADRLYEQQKVNKNDRPPAGETAAARLYYENRNSYN